MSDERDLKTKVDLRVEPDAAGEGSGASGGGRDGARDGEPGSAAGPGTVTAWVSRTFPGHEHAFWGGVAGLLVAVAIFVVGLLQTLVVVALVLAGVACGQALDGDARVIDAVRRFLSRNQ